MWIIGDEFTFNSYQQYFRDNKHEGKPMMYTFEKFEVKEFLSTKYSGNKSPMGRILNNLIYAVNSYLQVPKLIVFILDADLTRYVHSDDDLTNTIHIGKITEWLVREVFRTLESFKDMCCGSCLRLINISARQTM